MAHETVVYLGSKMIEPLPSCRCAIGYLILALWRWHKSTALRLLVRFGVGRFPAHNLIMAGLTSCSVKIKN